MEKIDGEKESSASPRLDNFFSPFPVVQFLESPIESKKVKKNSNSPL